MTQPRHYQSPTFRDIRPGQPRVSRRFGVPSPALGWYDPIRVAQYSPTFVDVTIVPDAGDQEAITPAPTLDIRRMLLNRRWGAGLTRGTAMATLVGGLLMASPVATVAAQSLDPPPPVGTSDDDGFLERLIEAIGEDSPLWQFVSPGDGSALWRLIERAGPENEVWDRLREAGPDHWVWERLAELGADNPIWDEILPEGSEGPAVAASAATERALGAVGTQAESSVYFVERTGVENPLSGADVGSGPAPAFVDIDGDGDFDAFIGSTYYPFFNNTSSSPTVADYDPVTDSKFCYGYIQFFENLDVDNGGGGQAVFIERIGPANPFDGKDVDCAPKPAFVDIDDEGDFDAFIGNKEGTIKYFRNDSSPGHLEFTGPITASNPLSVSVGLLSAPSFVDIDDDDDFDAFTGNISGTIKYFENQGTAGAPNFVEQMGGNNPLDFVDVGEASAPTFADVDGRGDEDAVIGDAQGYVHFFENMDFDNDGSLGDPDFVERTGDENPFDGVDVGDTCVPDLVDIDGDGDFDAFIGSDTMYYSDGGGVGDAGDPGEYDGITNGKVVYSSVRFFENPNIPGVGGATELFSPLETLGPTVAAAAAGLAAAVGGGAALLRHGRRKS